MNTESVKNRDVPLVVGYGGGENSIALCIGLRNRGIRPDLILFADTKGEKPRTYSFVDDVLPAWLSANGFPALTKVWRASPTHPSLEQECLTNKTLPSRAFGFSSCAHKWKIEPQEKFMNHWPQAIATWAAGNKPIKILGYDAGEGHRSASAEDEKLLYWYPLREWGMDRSDCEELREREGLPPPGKSACFYCPASTKAEVIQLSRESPDLFARAVAMERNAEDLKTVVGLGRHWTWEELVRADAAQFRLFPEAPSGCVICVESSE